MRCISVEPGVKDSAKVEAWPPPSELSGTVLMQTRAVGVCGTDAEILRGEYGESPLGESRLIIGHEALAQVLDAPRDSGLTAGDYVVPMVRWPDPVPCLSCAAGEWDMCRNGQFTEHGINGRHGFAVEQLRLSADRLVPVGAELGELGVLLEPASIVAKAWEQIERIGSRMHWEPSRVLITGAGPIGLLAAMMARQRGFKVDVLDRVTEGPKPELVRSLGAAYHHEGVDAIDCQPDIVLECTGVGQLVFEVMQLTAPAGIVCLTGISSGGRKLAVDLGSLNTSMVLENDVVFGTVNANRRHYEAAATALSKADHDWLARLISRRVPLSEWQQAFKRQPDDVKVVIEFPS